MYNAELFSVSNHASKRDAKECLEECSHLVDWKTHGKALDIGCGDGSITFTILSPLLPNCSTIVGSDKSKNMVEYAREFYKGAGRDFVVLDIEGDLPLDMKDSFDHVFSFYTIHWIRNQEKAFRNIFDMLSAGGDCLLLFLGRMPIFQAYRILTKDPKWGKWIKNVENYVSPYNDSQEPEKEIQEMMQRIGFSSVEVYGNQKVFKYEMDMLRNLLLAINPFEIPKELHKDYIEDYLIVLRDSSDNDFTNNDPAVFGLSYKLITAYGNK